MKKGEIENIIIEFLTGEISQNKRDILDEWLQEPTNKKTFEEYVRLNYIVDSGTKKFDSEKVKNSLTHEFNKDRSIFYKKRYTKFFKYAAAIVVLIGLTYFFKDNFIAGPQIEIPVPKEESITIRLDNGQLEKIDINGSKEVLDKYGKIVGVQEKDQIKYGEEVSDEEELVYNILNVPYGKTFKVILSDGTSVHLNAGTELKYPVKFLRGNERKVFLIGEAYFEVTEDAQHPFVVNTENIDIKVLGTKFNVTSYKNDAITSAVLVSGSVEVTNKTSNNEKVIIKPDERAYVSQSEMNIDVVDVDKHLAWTKGILMFRDDRFEDILKKLERFYNITITNEYTDLNNVRYNGTFDIENIIQVLKAFQVNTTFNYQIKNNAIIITKT